MQAKNAPVREEWIPEEGGLSFKEGPVGDWRNFVAGETTDCLVCSASGHVLRFSARDALASILSGSENFVYHVGFLDAVPLSNSSVAAAANL